MKVQSYIFFDGRCEEALEFYKKVLGAEIGPIMRMSDAPPGEGMPVTEATKNKIMHVGFRIGETELMASDGMAGGHPKFDGVSLSVTADSEADCKRIFADLGKGGRVTQPLIKTFFSPAFGMVNDKFGVSWMVTV